MNRVFLEKVGGEYQGAVFRFQDGLQSAALSLAFLKDGSLLVGESNRGWNSQGTRSFGLERIQWTGQTPFEVQKMEAQPDGFRVTFTDEVDTGTASNLGSYQMSSYTYLYHQKYGGDEVETQKVTISQVVLEPGGRSVLLRCEGLREGYVHELIMPGVRSKKGVQLTHAEGYYTLNRLPGK
ncbi:hypothetical protein [Verrucomicrobium spinosum]|uniref:hypothetical protein n=1 Tax=Verrucomicrobium spinosum TaxID=2736 RepID=UPI001C49324A|nr:hypothetical protein [Verrucomicrobium spinosum]